MELKKIKKEWGNNDLVLYECPFCKGKGKFAFLIKKKHKNRKLPLDYFCFDCNMFVTKWHASGYSGHEVIKLNGVIVDE